MKLLSKCFGIAISFLLLLRQQSLIMWAKSNKERLRLTLAKMWHLLKVDLLQYNTMAISQREV